MESSDNQQRDWRLQVKLGPLTDSERLEVLALVAAAEASDGVAPISEAPLLRLTTATPWLTQVLVRAIGGGSADHVPEQLLGYAQIDRSGPVASAELVVHPDARRCGIGRALLATAEADARLPAVSGAGNQGGLKLRVWAHGDLPAAQAFAAAHGYQAVRELLLLSKPLAADLTLAARLASEDAEDDFATPVRPVAKPRCLPSGFVAHSFVPGRDDAAWVKLNALVFAEHPEQGRLTLADLQARQQEPWFAAGDFHLVTQSETGELVAFNWIKVTPPSSVSNESALVANHGAGTGEIYAIGVHPAYRRQGLGAFLLATAFEHMVAQGLSHATLYVEGDNDAALAAYYQAGFLPLAADVQYGKPNPEILK